ncbi:MAG: hypothetical protein KDD51_15350 [Bdellovibrionales bacterium]|nr:hypothetical protein [Bdellovibrionales bacterium]
MVFPRVNFHWLLCVVWTLSAPKALLGCSSHYADHGRVVSVVAKVSDVAVAGPDWRQLMGHLEGPKGLQWEERLRIPAELFRHGGLETSDSFLQMFATVTSYGPGQLWGQTLLRWSRRLGAAYGERFGTQAEIMGPLIFLSLTNRVVENLRRSTQRSHVASLSPRTAAAMFLSAFPSTLDLLRGEDGMFRQVQSTDRRIQDLIELEWSYLLSYGFNHVARYCHAYSTLEAYLSGFVFPLLSERGYGVGREASSVFLVPPTRLQPSIQFRSIIPASATGPFLLVNLYDFPPAATEVFDRYGVWAWKMIIDGRLAGGALVVPQEIAIAMGTELAAWELAAQWYRQKTGIDERLGRAG